MVKEKKKKWYSIVAPKLLNSVEVGEAYLSDLGDIKNRSFETNLMSLTDDPKRQNVKVRLLVDEIKDDKAYTSLLGYEISPSYIRRLSKRAKMKSDESFPCVTKDGVNVRIKILVMFKNKLNGSAASLLRKELKGYVCDSIKKSNFENVLGIILNQGLQRDLRSRLNKIYPILGCVIRDFSRL